jgi:hypothetical protein
MTENLSYQPLSSIALNRSADFLGGGDSQTPDRLLVGHEKDGAQAAGEANTVLVDQLKVCPSPDPLVGTEPA